MPRILLEIPSARDRVTIEFTVDTAFNGYLALPLSTLTHLEALYLSESPVSLADASEIGAEVDELTILWDGRKRIVEVLSLSDHGSPLLGVELLADNLIILEMTDGGEVTIEPL